MISIQRWIADNPVLFATLLWPIFTAVLSSFYSYLDGFPRVHAALSAMVAMGFDLPSALAAIQRLITGRDAPPPGLGKRNWAGHRAPPVKGPPAIPPCATPKRRDPVFIIGVMPCAGILVFASLLAGCSWLTPSHVQDVATIAECVLAHESETPVQIAKDCAVENVQTVIDILTAHTDAEAREKAAAARAQDGGPDAR